MSARNDIPTFCVNVQRTNDIRKFSNTNYIPYYSIQGGNNINDWYNAYQPYLIQMYLFVMNIIKSRYPIYKIKTKSNKLFNYFISLIYYCSSKHIDKYLNYSKEFNLRK